MHKLAGLHKLIRAYVLGVTHDDTEVSLGVKKKMALLLGETQSKSTSMTYAKLREKACYWLTALFT